MIISQYKISFDVIIPIKALISGLYLVVRKINSVNVLTKPAIPMKMAG